jgi:hypothetical protein
MRGGLPGRAAEYSDNHEASTVDINDLKEFLCKKLDPYNATVDPIKHWLCRRQVTTLLARISLDCMFAMSAFTSSFMRRRYARAFGAVTAYQYHEER